MKLLSGEITDQYNRLNAPCANCGADAPGEVVTLRFSAGSLILPICENCSAAYTDLPEVKAQLISHEAAALFHCKQNPEDIRQLSDELVRMKQWIAQHGAPGQPCDNCGQPLVQSEPISTATFSAPFGQVLHVLCALCKDTGTPRIMAACERFVARVISNRAAVFIPELLDAGKRRVN
jgi:hypothetical protein